MIKSNPVIYIGIKELRKSMAKITAQAHKNRQRVVVFKNNKAIFELRPLYGKSAKLEETLQSIERAKADIKAGRFFTQEEVERMFGLR